MGKLVVFQPFDNLLYFVMGKFAGEFFEGGLVCFCRWRVKKNDRPQIISKRLRDASELLSQHPYTDAEMSRSKCEFGKLPCASFDIF